MGEVARQAVPIVVMFGFVLLLAPFIGFGLWLAFDGDRIREEQARAAATRFALPRAGEALAPATPARAPQPTGARIPAPASSAA